MPGRVGTFTQAMADHRKQHRLHVFRNYIIARRETPKPRRGEQCQAGPRGTGPSKLRLGGVASTRRNT